MFVQDCDASLLSGRSALRRRSFFVKELADPVPKRRTRLAWNDRQNRLRLRKHTRQPYSIPGRKRRRNIGQAIGELDALRVWTHSGDFGEKDFGSKHPAFLRTHSLSFRFTGLIAGDLANKGQDPVSPNLPDFLGANSRVLEDIVQRCGTQHFLVIHSGLIAEDADDFKGMGGVGQRGGTVAVDALVGFPGEFERLSKQWQSMIGHESVWR